MNELIKLNYNDRSFEVASGTTVCEAAGLCDCSFADDVILARFNKRICETSKQLTASGDIEFISRYDQIGVDIYTRTALFMLSKAVRDIFGQEAFDNFTIHFTIANGYYCEIKGFDEISAESVQQLKDAMQKMQQENISIKKENVHKDVAKKMFAEAGMKDKCELLKYRMSSTMNIYHMDDYVDYNYGYMAASTGIIDTFDLLPYQHGFVLTLPKKQDPKHLLPFKPADKLFSTLSLTTEWNRKLDVQNIYDLNEKIACNEISQMILVQEALQEKKIAEIATNIVNSGKRIVLIAGPSSSGKTTFSHRLSIQLQAAGARSYPIPVDDYFVNREDTPLDEFGNYNYETIKAIDTELFNAHVKQLLDGEEVDLPTYNFLTGQREYKGRKLKIGDEDILVIEGIHALNDAMTYSLDPDVKFKIYISALTTLNIDKHNRISTSEARMIRRMVRDAAHRGASASKTISMWYSVRRGEEENIFPYQENADVMFNSSLIYELPAIKQYAVPLLYSVPEESPEYAEAMYLLKFLDYFLSIDDRMIPANSIIREFIGNSCFNV